MNILVVLKKCVPLIIVTLHKKKKTNAIVTYRKKYLMLSKECVANIILQEGHLYGSALLKACQKNGNPSMCKEAQIIFSDDIICWL